MNRLELKRRAFHLISCLVFVSLIYRDILKVWMLALLLVSAIAVSLITKRTKIPVIYWFFKNFDRPEDLKKFPGRGAIFVIFGVLLVVLLFPKDIAMAAIMILGLGDTVAPLIGQYGRIKHPFSDQKFLEGAIAGVMAGFLGALLFVEWHEALLASFFAMTAEGMNIMLRMRKVDDNLVVPLVAGAVIWVIRFFL